MSQLCSWLKSQLMLIVSILYSSFQILLSLATISESLGGLSGGIAHVGWAQESFFFSFVLWHLNLFSTAKTKYPRLDTSQ